MQNGHITLTSPKGFYGYTDSIGGVCVAAVDRFHKCSLFLRPINAELTVLSAWLTPPHLTFSKYNTSQDSIDFRVVLFLFCLRAFCLARSVSSRAFFVAFGFVRCFLSIPLSISPLLFSCDVSYVGAVSNRDRSFCMVPGWR